MFTSRARSMPSMMPRTFQVCSKGPVITPSVVGWDKREEEAPGQHETPRVRHSRRGGLAVSGAGAAATGPPAHRRSLTPLRRISGAQHCGVSIRPARSRLPGRTQRDAGDSLWRRGARTHGPAGPGIGCAQARRADGGCEVRRLGRPGHNADDPDCHWGLRSGKSRPLLPPRGAGHCPISGAIATSSLPIQGGTDFLPLFIDGSHKSLKRLLQFPMVMNLRVFE